MKISKKELNSSVDRLREFLKTFDKTSKCSQIPLPKLKISIRSTKLKDNLFVYYYRDIIDHRNRQNGFSFRFGNINFCVFRQKFELHANQFIITEIVNPNHREVHHFYRNRYYVSNKCQIFKRDYDV